MYKLICYYGGEEYPFSEVGAVVANDQTEIYGKPGCPSALYLHPNEGKWSRVFKHEEGAPSSLCPCPVCLKEHYELWKEDRLETHALRVKPAYTGTADLCTVFLANHERKTLNTLNTPGFPEVAAMSVEAEEWQDFNWAEFKIEGDFCVISLQYGNLGYVIVWDYVQDRVVHLNSVPYVRCSTVFNGQVVSMYQTVFWHRVVDPHFLREECWAGPIREMCPPYGAMWYSVTPLGRVDPEYEPDLTLLPLVPDGFNEDPFADEPPWFDVHAEGGTLVFQAGTNECRLESL